MGVVSRSVANAFRNKVRSGAVVVILAVAIGLALAMLVAHQAVGAKVEALKASVGTSLTVNPAGSRGGMGGGEPLTSAELATAAGVEHVTAVNGTLTVSLQNTETAAATTAGPGGMGGPGGRGGGSTTSGTTSLVSAVDAGTLGARNNGTTTEAAAAPSFSIPIQATGVATSVSATGAAIDVVDGAPLSDFTAGSTQALLGSTLAEKNALTLGSTFTVQDRILTVTGLFDAGTEFDNNALFLPLAAAQELTDQSEQLSSFTVTVDSIDHVEATRAAVTAALGEDTADVTSGSTDVTSAIGSLSSVQSISLIAFLASLVTAGLIVLLIMIMVVRERRREIGVLKAIGASNTTIGVQFVLEALVLVILGTVVGGVVASFASNPIVNALVAGNTSSTTSAAAGAQGGPGGGMGGGMGTPPEMAGGGLPGGDFTNTRGVLAGADQLIGTITTSLGWQTLAVGGLSILLIAAIGALIPALLTAKVRPIEVLRGE